MAKSKTDKSDARNNSAPSVTVTGSQSFTFTQTVTSSVPRSFNLSGPSVPSPRSYDPVVAASVPGNAPGRVVARPSSSLDSLSGRVAGVSATYGVADAASSRIAEALATGKARQRSNLTIAERQYQPPKPGVKAVAPAKSAAKVSSTSSASSTSSRDKAPDKVPEKMTCKARPDSNKPKGGGGSGKRFVPWCT